MAASGFYSTQRNAGIERRRKNTDIRKNAEESGGEETKKAIDAERAKKKHCETTSSLSWTK